MSGYHKTVGKWEDKIKMDEGVVWLSDRKEMKVGWHREE
jgi:hypothetical protein